MTATSQAACTLCRVFFFFLQCVRRTRSIGRDTGEGARFTARSFDRTRGKRGAGGGVLQDIAVRSIDFVTKVFCTSSLFTLDEPSRAARCTPRISEHSVGKQHEEKIRAYLPRPVLLFASRQFFDSRSSGILILSDCNLDREEIISRINRGSENNIVVASCHDKLNV